MITIKTNRVLATAKQPKIKDGGKAIEIYCASCRWDKKKKYYVCRSGFGLELPEGCAGHVRLKDYGKAPEFMLKMMRDKWKELVVFLAGYPGAKPSPPFEVGGVMGWIHVCRDEACELEEAFDASKEEGAIEEPTFFG